LWLIMTLNSYVLKREMTLYDLMLPLLVYASWFYFKFVHILFTVWNCVKNRVSVPKPTDEDLNQLLSISATQAAEAIRTREIRSQQLIEVYIRRIQYVDNLLNAVVVENYDEAIETARTIDDYIQSLDPESDDYKNLEIEKPLFGVPFTCKDSIRVKGLRTVCGIPAFADAPFNEEDAEVVKRLRAAGAIHLAVTNVPEAALWWETNNGIYGITRNPYDLRLAAGGSSGGEGSLIGAAGSVIGVGSDFGGSIRIPSMLNGIFGLKPSPGLIPMKGHIPEKLPKYHLQMISIGPMCRYAKDLSVMLRAMVGPNNVKPLRLDEPVNLRNVRVFYMKGIDSLLVSPLHGDVLYALQKAVKYFETKYDNTCYCVDFPIAHYAVDLFLNSMRCDGSLPVKNVLAGFTPDESVNVWVESFKAIFGQSDHSAAALQTGIVDELPDLFKSDQNFVIAKREQLKRELTDLLGDEGILIFPSLPRPHYYHNEPLLTPFDFVYAGLFNVLGLPVVSCPMGLSSSGVPLSVQVVAGPNADRLLLAAACDLEEGFGGWTPRELH